MVKGNIESIKVYEKALTEEEIKEIYQDEIEVKEIKTMNDDEYLKYFRALKYQFNNFFYYTGANHKQNEEKAHLKIREILEEIRKKSNDKEDEPLEIKFDGRKKLWTDEELNKNKK